MRNRKTRSRSAIESLRLAIDCMPVATRQAMLTGLRQNERIIVGAYVDDQGGICPMLAAHRCGGRTDFISFAKSWDRFTRAAGKSRRASQRELRILIAHLEDSLECSDGTELDVAIAEHRKLVIASRPRRRQRRLADAADPSGPIIARRLRRALRPRSGRGEEPTTARGGAARVPVRG
jgi:hypothetical protein